MPTATAPVLFEPRSGEGWRDPFPMYRRLRDEDPVHHVERGDYWVLSRFADVFAAARDTATFSLAGGLTFGYGERERIGLTADAGAPMVMLDPPDHTDFRRLVARGFTPRHVAGIEPDVISDLVRAGDTAGVPALRILGFAFTFVRWYEALPFDPGGSP